jgi:hypothetical protein
MFFRKKSLVIMQKKIAEAVTIPETNTKNALLYVTIITSFDLKVI